MLEGLRSRVNGMARAALAAFDATPPLPAAPPAPPQTSTSGLIGLARARIPGIDQLINLASGIGTSRDKRIYNDYLAVRQLTQIELDNMYQTSWSAAKTVNIPAEDSIREWIQPSWDGYDEDLGGRDALTVAEATFGVRQKTFQARKWARLYGGGALIPLIRGDEDLSKPLVLDRIGKDSLLALHVLDRWRLAATGPLDEDPYSPNVGYPISYQVRTTMSVAPIVHWSRVIRFDGFELPYYALQRNGYWHDSELRHVVDNIKDYDHARAQIMAMLGEANVDIQLVEGLGDLMMSTEGRKLARERFEEAALLKSIINTLVMDAKDKFQQKTVSFANIPEVWRTSMLDLSAATDIPATRFFAQSPVGLSATGDSDLENYDDRIHSEQETRLRPAFDRTYQILMRTVFGSMPKNFKFVFNPLRQMTMVEKSTVQMNNATRDTAYEKMGAITVGVVARQLKYDNTYEVMEREDVRDAEAMADVRAEERQLGIETGGGGGGGGGEEPGGQKQPEV